jgi:hypothetical protein
MDDVPSGTHDPWPDPRPNQTRVLLLGTYHMAGGDDTVNVDADDVLADDRQAELRDLVDRLAEWEADRVAVEVSYDEQDGIDEEYAAYRSGERRYEAGRRSEVVQVAYRLADRLDHDRVAAVDEFPPGPDDDPFADRAVDSSRKRDVPLPDPETMRRETDERLAESTAPEYLAWVNTETELRDNHDLMFDTGVRTDPEGLFDSPAMLAYWYDRNLRTVHHTWRTMADDDDDRVLLVVGSGHVRVLRHLFDEAPMFCPMSPRPYLPDPA